MHSLIIRAKDGSNLFVAGDTYDGAVFLHISKGLQTVGVALDWREAKDAAQTILDIVNAKPRGESNGE